MGSWEIEQLRRSVVMVQGGSVGPLTKQAALDLIAEFQRIDRLTARYREVIDLLRAALNGLET